MKVNEFSSRLREHHVMKIDFVILRVLSLSFSNITLASYDDFDFIIINKFVIIPLNDNKKLFFLKINAKNDFKIMFANEHVSLNALHIILSLYSQFSTHEKLNDELDAFLVTNFLNLRISQVTIDNKEKNSKLLLTQKIKKLHITFALVSTNYKKSMFKFLFATYCENTKQNNT